MGKIFSRIRGTGEASGAPEQVRGKNNVKSQDASTASSSPPSTSHPVETAIVAEEIVADNGGGSNLKAVPSVESAEPVCSSSHLDEPIQEATQPSSIESEKLLSSSKSPAKEDESTAGHNESSIKGDDIAVTSTLSGSHDMAENATEKGQEETTQTSDSAKAHNIPHEVLPSTENPSKEKPETNVLTSPTTETNVEAHEPEETHKEEDTSKTEEQKNEAKDNNRQNNEKPEVNEITSTTTEAIVDDHEPKETHQAEDTLKTEEPKIEVKEEEHKSIEKPEETHLNESEQGLTEIDTKSVEISETLENDAEKVEHQAENISQQEVIPAKQESYTIDSDANESNETKAPTASESILTHDVSQPTEATSGYQSAEHVSTESTTTETSSATPKDMSAS